MGQTVPVTVTKLANFGAFELIDRGIEGIIHISELSQQLIKHPKDVVNEGDELELKIIRIEPARRRLGLSLKQIVDGSDVEVSETPQPSEEVSDGFGDLFEDSASYLPNNSSYLLRALNAQQFFKVLGAGA